MKYQWVVFAFFWSMVLSGSAAVHGQDDELPSALPAQATQTQILIEQSLQRDVAAMLFSLRGPSALSLGYPVASDPFWFVRLEPIAKELQLTAEQTRALAEIEEQIGTKIIQRNDQLAELTSSSSVAQDFAAQAEGMQKEIQALIEQRKTAIESTLSESQRKRLNELVLQIEFLIGRDANTLTSDRLAAELTLTDEQKPKLMEKAREIDLEFQKEFRALVEKTREKLKAELNAEQKTRLDELLGKPFDFESLDWSNR